MNSYRVKASKVIAVISMVLGLVLLLLGIVFLGSYKNVPIWIRIIIIVIGAIAFIYGISEAVRKNNQMHVTEVVRVRGKQYDATVTGYVGSSLTDSKDSSGRHNIMASYKDETGVEKEIEVKVGKITTMQEFPVGSRVRISILDDEARITESPEIQHPF